jgi:long-subunit acyl-CoA synthetase (AMP-forming)
MSGGERTLVQAFFDTANRFSTRVALRHKRGGSWHERTFGDYAREVRRAGRALMHLGVEPGGKVSILAPNRPEWMIGALGAMAAGGAPVGIYGTSTADQVGYIAAHAESRVAIVHDAKQLAKFRAEAANLPRLEHFILLDGKPQQPDELTWDDFLALADQTADAALDARWKALTPQSVATLIYTSGTTGVPKAVMISHRNVTFAAEGAQRRLGVSERDHLLSYLPLSHIAEQVLSLHAPAIVGYTVSCLEDMTQLGDYLREVRPTVFFGVPRVWEKMQAKMMEAAKSAPPLRRKIAAWARATGLRAWRAIEAGQKPPLSYYLAKKLVYSKVRERLGLDRCWMMVSGAAAISRSTLEFFFSLDLPIYEVYGMSEVTGPGTLAVPGAFRIGTVGRAIDGTEVKIAEDGEILMRGPHVFLGYFKDEAATKEMIDEEGWIHSGDIGELDADGYLRITDRKKDLFKTAGGKYIAPQPLEGKLKAIPGVGQAVVIGEGRKYAVALLTLDADTCKAMGRTPEEMAADPVVVQQIEGEVRKINATLAPYETIKRIKVLPTEFTVEAGEMTPSLKLRRKVVNQRYAAIIDGLYEGGAGGDA